MRLFILLWAVISALYAIASSTSLLNFLIFESCEDLGELSDCVKGLSSLPKGELRPAIDTILTDLLALVESKAASFEDSLDALNKRATRYIYISDSSSGPETSSQDDSSETASQTTSSSMMTAEEAMYEKLETVIGNCNFIKKYVEEIHAYFLRALDICDSTINLTDFQDSKKARRKMTLSVTLSEIRSKISAITTLVGASKNRFEHLLDNANRHLELYMMLLTKKRLASKHSQKASSINVFYRQIRNIDLDVSLSDRVERMNKVLGETQRELEEAEHSFHKISLLLHIDCAKNPDLTNSNVEKARNMISNGFDFVSPVMDKNHSLFTALNECTCFTDMIRRNYEDLNQDIGEIKQQLMANYDLIEAFIEVIDGELSTEGLCATKRSYDKAFEDLEAAAIELEEPDSIVSLSQIRDRVMAVKYCVDSNSLPQQSQKGTATEG